MRKNSPQRPLRYNCIRPKNLENGLTLLEVMVAVVVLTVGILALNAMQVSAIRVNSAAGNLTKAVSAGQERLESLLGLPYDHEALSDVDTDNQLSDQARRESLRRPLPPLPEPAIPDLGKYRPEYQARRGKYLICWNIEDDLLVPRTKSVNVVVTWREGALPRAVLLEHVISEFR